MMRQIEIPLFRVKSEEFQSSLSTVRTMCHHVWTPIYLLIHPSGRRVIPSGHQTDKHHLSGRRVSSVQTPTSYQEASMQTCSVRTFQQHVRTPISSRTDHWLFPKFQEREDHSTVRTMWYPVRTRISVRQESQFKMNRPNIWQLWSGRWCIVYGNCRFDFNRPDVSLSWSGRTRIRYENCVLKFSRPDTPAPWSGRGTPVMEIICSGRASVRTIEPSRPEDVLIQERFLRENFRKSCRTVVRPDGHGPPSGWLPGKFCLTLILTPSL
jgi:hypothetical protein